MDPQVKQKVDAIWDDLGIEDRPTL
jgi:hypothetical protein